MIGPGTLPGQGIDRMDMLRYAEWVSGRKPLKGDGEYPILVTRGNAMNYKVCSRAAKGLLEFLQLPDNPRPTNK